MYNKTKPDFENYWLDSIEINLKFSCQPELVSLNKYRVYSQQNEWLQCGRRADKNLRQAVNKNRLLLPRLSAAIRRGKKGIADLFQTFRYTPIQKPSRRCHPDIYQQRLDNIIALLARINRRDDCRHKEAGISNIRREKNLTDETLEVALRIILKRRE